MKKTDYSIYEHNSINAKNRTYLNVKNFWEDQAIKKGKTPTVTIRDHFFRLHDIQATLLLIPEGSTVLDVGCGNGFGSFILNTRASFTHGIDYSQGMIKAANNLLKGSSYRKKLFSDWGYSYKNPETKHLQFSVKDVLRPLDLKKFDIIAGQRVLVNIPNHEEQMKVIKNLTRQAYPNTKFLFVEATLQGHDKTNKLREKVGLPVLERYWRNCYMDEDKLSDWNKAGVKILTIVSFDTYMLLSKIIYPAACGIGKIKFISGANKAAMEIASLFRTKKHVDEAGLETVLNLYLNNLKKYDAKEYKAIKKWVDNKNNLSLINNFDWSDFGHQKLFVYALL